MKQTENDFNKKVRFLVGRTLEHPREGIRQFINLINNCQDPTLYSSDYVIDKLNIIEPYFNQEISEDIYERIKDLEVSFNICKNKIRGTPLKKKQKIKPLIPKPTEVKLSSPDMPACTNFPKIISKSGYVNKKYSFITRGNFPDNLKYVRYEFDWGGDVCKSSKTSIINNSGITGKVTHEFKEPGEYIIKARIISTKNNLYSPWSKGLKVVIIHKEKSPFKYFELRQDIASATLITILIYGMFFSFGFFIKVYMTDLLFISIALLFLTFIYFSITSRKYMHLDNKTFNRYQILINSIGFGFSKIVIILLILLFIHLLLSNSLMKLNFINTTFNFFDFIRNFIVLITIPILIVSILDIYNYLVSTSKEKKIKPLNGASNGTQKTKRPISKKKLKKKATFPKKYRRSPSKPESKIIKEPSESQSSKDIYTIPTSKDRWLKIFKRTQYDYGIKLIGSLDDEQLEEFIKALIQNRDFKNEWLAYTRYWNKKMKNKYFNSKNHLGVKIVNLSPNYIEFGGIFAIYLLHEKGKVGINKTMYGYFCNLKEIYELCAITLKLNITINDTILDEEYVLFSIEK